MADTLNASNPTNQTVTPSALTVPPKQQNFSHPALPAAPRKHVSRIIAQTPVATTHIPVSIKSLAGSPPAQYKAMICVDYRPSPPTPGTLNGAPIYAPLDYIPTTTADRTYLDLMIVIVRINPNVNTGFNLSRLDVELPVFDTKTDNKTIEPLLPSEPYVGHARMARNLHFVPTLYNNELVSGAKPILGIRLLPRSGKPQATIAVANTLRSQEATVRLSMCRIAPTVKQQLVLVAMSPKDRRNQWRGKCSALLRETYTTGDVRQPTVMRETKFDVLKMDLKDGVLSDRDIDGNAVFPFQYS